MIRNFYALVGGSVEKKSVGEKAVDQGSARQSNTRWAMTAALVAAIVVGAAGAAFYLAAPGHSAKANAPQPKKLSASTISLPLFFEPNQGQTDARVKFMARGAGYGMFLTANEAVLELQQPSHVETRLAASPAVKSQSSVIRMRLDGANSAAQVHGEQPLPGQSSYFIGNDRSKWRTGVPQFARVAYRGVYPGIDLVYYGNDRQLEYDFRVAPGANADRIALSFQGATARLDSGDLVLSTAGGDVRFHAPHVYQSAANSQTPVEGSFRQLADNKIGFTIGSYDHSRELVIDPVLSYSTYLGPNTGIESLVKVAVDSSNNIYLAGSTTATNFPVTSGALQTSLGGPGAQNLFIAKLNPTAASQLVYATYLGGSGIDNLAGISVDINFDLFVAGTTTSTDFPTANAFQSTATFAGNQTHGFVSELAFTNPTYTLSYSTYLAGNGNDVVTGLAVDNVQDAYVTGTTTSTNDQSNGFPSNPNGYQLTSNSPGNPQFFASKIHTGGSGTASMLYSTYFGGGNFGVGNAPIVTGGGIAVDPPTTNSNINMYFTGATNMQSIVGINQEPRFFTVNAWQPCLNQPGVSTCVETNPGNSDVILVKINPNQPGSPPLYSTYLGGRSNDTGIAVAVDTASNAYVTGSTNSGDVTDSPHDWNCVSPCLLGPYGYLGVSGNPNAFIAKIGNQTQSNTVYPLNYFTWLGGSGPDRGEAILVDTVGTAHVAGTTFSINPSLPVSTDALQFQCGGSGGGFCTGDAFAALVSTSSTSTGNYVTYLGGSSPDVGTGVALDPNNLAYIAGSTQSADFPVTPATAYQPNLQGTQNAFVTKIGNTSDIQVTAGATSPSPNPVAAGQQATFTFNLKNNGTDPASNLNFFAIVPTTGVASTPTASVTSGSGSCGTLQTGNQIPCFISTLAVGATAIVTVNVTPSIPPPNSLEISVGCNFSVNGGLLQGCPISQQDSIVDFSMSPAPPSKTINAGDLASFVITLTPEPSYNATITMSQTTSPAIVTSTTPVFTNPTVTLAGSGAGTTTLNIQTVARPVTKGALMGHGPFYATWLPIGGLGLLGFGFGAGRKRRRWLAGLALGVLAGLIVLQAACGSSSNATSTSGGTAAGIYTITITGSSGTTASHQTKVTLQVN